MYDVSNFRNFNLSLPPQKTILLLSYMSRKPKFITKWKIRRVNKVVDKADPIRELFIIFINKI